jgi:hypothetical protein
LFLLICGTLFNANAQTGIFYYTGLDKTFVHNNIVEIREAINTEIYLVGKTSTADYSKTAPFFGRLDKNGTMLFNKNFPEFSIWNLNKMVITEGFSIKIYGTTIEKEKYNPFFLQITPEAKIEKKNSQTVVYSTFNSDVADKDNNIVAAYTKIGETKRYNIEINKINPNNDVVLWSTPIKSTNDEEASRIIICSDNSIMVLAKEFKKNMTVYTPIIYKLSPSGNIVWRITIAVPPNFFTQDIVQIDRSTFIYMCSYGKEYLGTSETRLIQLSGKGEPTKSTTIQHINGNGILLLEGKRILVFGSNLAILSGRVVTRAKYAIVGKNLELEYQRELGSTDKPDALMPQNVATNFPTTSDFSCATVLKDGRIAIAGKVFMPLDPKNPNPRGGDRFNAPLIIILDKTGKGIKN